MSDQTVARRYAQALFAIGAGNGQLESLGDELGQVVATLKDNQELSAFFRHQLIPHEGKKEVLRRVFTGRISSVVLNLVLLLVDKRREIHLELINKIYHTMAMKAANVVEGEVVSVRGLSDKHLEALERQLSLSVGRTVRLRQRSEPGLMGGVVVRLGDRVIDGSINQRLKVLERRLARAEGRGGASS